LIEEIVSVDGTMKDKREALLAKATDEQRAALNEFVGWFEKTPIKVAS